MIVSNSSPLIALDRIGRLELLRWVTPDLHVPSAVLREVTPRLVLPSWITVTPLAAPVHLAVRRAPLGSGEQEAISLALERRAAAVILDDRAARRTAASLGLTVLGVLRILLLAKQRGYVTAIKPDLDMLRSVSFHIAPSIYAHALAEAGEQ